MRVCIGVAEKCNRIKAAGIERKQKSQCFVVQGAVFCKVELIYNREDGKQFVFSRALGGNSAVPCRSQAVGRSQPIRVDVFHIGLDNQTNNIHWSLIQLYKETHGFLTANMQEKSIRHSSQEQKDGQTGNRNRDLVYAKDALYH